MDKITKIIIFIIILIIIVNLMPKNENFYTPPQPGVPQQTNPVYLYNDYYKLYLHLTDNNQLHLMKSRPNEPQFNLDTNGYILYSNNYITKLNSNSVYNINPLPIKFVRTLNGNATFKLVDNYIRYFDKSENPVLTINDNNTFNINYIPSNKLDSKNKFVIIK